jgi:hypothetical protein
MRLKDTINQIMDFAKAHDNDVQIAHAKLVHMVVAEGFEGITLYDLNKAKSFIDSHYDIVVKARQTGDCTALDEALSVWE